MSGDSVFVISRISCIFDENALLPRNNLPVMHSQQFGSAKKIEILIFQKNFKFLSEFEF